MMELNRDLCGLALSSILVLLVTGCGDDGWGRHDRHGEDGTDGCGCDRHRNDCEAEGGCDPGPVEEDAPCDDGGIDEGPAVCGDEEAIDCNEDEDCGACCEATFIEGEALVWAANIDCQCSDECAAECEHFCQDPDNNEASPECEACGNGRKSEGDACNIAFLQACADDPACMEFIGCMQACQLDE